MSLGQELDLASHGNILVKEYAEGPSAKRKGTGALVMNQEDDEFKDLQLSLEGWFVDFRLQVQISSP